MTLPYTHTLHISGALEHAVRMRAESLAAEVARYRSSPPPQARAMFSLAERTDDIADIYALAAEWRDVADALVVIGAGGSGLSGRALARLRGGLHLGAVSPQVHVLDNLDPDAFEALIANLNLRRTAALIVSKSGTTLETLAQTAAFLQAMQAAGVKDFSARMAAIAVEGDHALKSLMEAHHVPLLHHDPELCGRFSTLSSVGLLPAAFAGVDVAALRAGARAALSDAGWEYAAEGAAFQVEMLSRGRNINVLVSYSERLAGLAAWWRQSWAESLGKDGTGSSPALFLGPADQHSQLQLFLGGANDKSFTFLLPPRGARGPVLHEAPGLPEALQGRTLGDIVGAQARATLDTLLAHERPVRSFALKEVSASSFGALMTQFTMEIVLAAALLGVNPFDQPAVEESKRLTLRYLTEAA